MLDNLQVICIYQHMDVGMQTIGVTETPSVEWSLQHCNVLCSKVSISRSLVPWLHRPCFFSAETLPSENGVSAEQHFSEEPMDTSSAPSLPPALRGTTEHRSPAGNSPHYTPQQPPLRRVSSNPSELVATRMLRRVEGTLCKRAWIYKLLPLWLRCQFCMVF